MTCYYAQPEHLQVIEEDQPKRWRIVGPASGDETGVELVLIMQGIITQKNLPPFNEYVYAPTPSTSCADILNNITVGRTSEKCDI